MIDNLQLYCVRRNEWNNLVEHQKSCVYLQICKNGRDKFPNFYLTSIKKNGKILKVIKKNYM